MLPTHCTAHALHWVSCTVPCCDIGLAWPGTPNATLDRACGSERELEICVEPARAQPGVWVGTNLDILLQLSAQVVLAS